MAHYIWSTELTVLWYPECSNVFMFNLQLYNVAKNISMRLNMSEYRWEMIIIGQMKCLLSLLISFNFITISLSFLIVSSSVAVFGLTEPDLYLKLKPQTHIRNWLLQNSNIYSHCFSIYKSQSNPVHPLDFPGFSSNFHNSCTLTSTFTPSRSLFPVFYLRFFEKE